MIGLSNGWQGWACGAHMILDEILNAFSLQADTEIVGMSENRRWELSGALRKIGDRLLSSLFDGGALAY